MKYPYTTTKLQGLLEVLDLDNRPLALLTTETVIAQRLRHRVVAVAVYDKHRRLLLQEQRTARRTEFSLGGGTAQKSVVGNRAQMSPSVAGGDICWALPMAHVPAGTASEDTAQHVITHDLQLQVGNLSLVQQHAVEDLTTGQCVTLYQARGAVRAPWGQTPELAQMFIDQDELTGLDNHFTEMLSPWVRRLLAEGCIKF